jgi:hypothetical protein
VHLSKRGTVFNAVFRDASGQQVWHTTGLRNRQQALRLARAWEKAEKEKGLAQGKSLPRVAIGRASGFSEEEAETIKSLQTSFGERMIWTFTHGDEVGKDEFEEMLKDASSRLHAGSFQFHRLFFALFSTRRTHSTHLVQCLSLLTSEPFIHT